MFAFSTQLKSHLITHSQFVTCKLCNKNLLDVTKLKAHEDIRFIQLTTV